MQHGDQGRRSRCKYLATDLICLVTNTPQPNGTLGPPIIHNLSKQGFDITLLTRNRAGAAEKYPPPIKTVQVDYDNHDQLTNLLREGAFESVVDLTNRSQLKVQKQLIDAAVAAKVPHFVPSSFGTGTKHPEVRRIPEIQPKAEMEGKWRCTSGLLSRSCSC